MTPELPKGILCAASMARAGHMLNLRAQVLIIGTGAGGSMVLHQLSKAGIDTLAIEVGGWLGKSDMSLREEEMLPEVFAEAGARGTDDFGTAVLQGRGVGGSTLHNTNLCKRLPDSVLYEWHQHHKLPLHGLAEDFDFVEKLLNVHPVPDDRINANNRLFAKGVEKLGYQGARLNHNRGDDCQASGFCELGCPNNGKRSAARALIPPALLTGNARILTHARVDRILTRQGAACGVSGYAIDPKTGLDLAPFVLQASCVVLAASATASAAIALRSGLPDPHRLMGTNLHLHPGAAVAGIFEPPHEPLRSWQGVPQSQECTEFLDVAGKGTDRVWLVPGFAHPAAASLFMPGFGASWASSMRLYSRLGVIIAMLHDHSQGRVSPGRGERVHLHYRLNRDDRAQMALGLREAARILLAAGASRVLVPLHPPLEVRRASDLSRITASNIRLMSPALTAVHPMSTLWMGADPIHSVVDPQGEHHHTHNLYVADGSLFPTSIGGPPQIPIYVMGKRVAQAILTK